jgi:hypothetical protein
MAQVRAQVQTLERNLAVEHEQALRAQREKQEAQDALAQARAQLEEDAQGMRAALSDARRERDQVAPLGERERERESESEREREREVRLCLNVLGVSGCTT